jgi:hypothetical protein
VKLLTLKTKFSKILQHIEQLLQGFRILMEVGCNVLNPPTRGQNQSMIKIKLKQLLYFLVYFFLYRVITKVPQSFGHILKIQTTKATRPKDDQYYKGEIAHPY